MSPLRHAVVDYLAVRRALGYQLERPARLLDQFVAYLEQVGAHTVTVEHAVAWATLPQTATPRWWGERLSVVRSFAGWLAAFDPATEVPPRDLLPCPPQRATPYLYSPADVVALLQATGSLHGRLRALTYHTLLGLLAVTGMRVGEALALDRADIDLTGGRLVVRHGKFGKARQLVLHPTTVDALGDYLTRRDQLKPNPATPALLLSNAGTRLRYARVGATFRQLVAHSGLQPRSGSCRPRLHDFRHTFAVNSLLDAYRDRADVAARLPVLSTWLGHTDPSHTYWYLSAAPELLALAGQRLEAPLDGTQR